jgi:type IV pilus assembly protein PilE
MKQMMKKHAGFSLLEVMVAMVILLILSSIAYASYRHAVLKSRRAEGKSALLQIMQQQERGYTQSASYVAFSQTTTKFRWFSGNTPADSAYELKGEACENDTLQNCIKITAMPGTANVNSNFRDSECGELSITSAGVKASSGNSNVNACW